MISTYQYLLPVAAAVAVVVTRKPPFTHEILVQERTMRAVTVAFGEVQRMTNRSEHVVSTVITTTEGTVVLVAVVVIVRAISGNSLLSSFL